MPPSSRRHGPRAERRRTLHRAFPRARRRRKLIAAASSQPRANAVAMFPQAAAANTSIFYAGGSPRSVGDVYAKLTGRLRSRAALRSPPDCAAALGAQDPVQVATQNPAPGYRRRGAGVRRGQPRPARSVTASRYSRACSPTARAAALTQTVNQLWTRPAPTRRGTAREPVHAIACPSRASQRAPDRV